jgi:hypothetical protein
MRESSVDAANYLIHHVNYTPENAFAIINDLCDQWTWLTTTTNYGYLRRCLPDFAETIRRLNQHLQLVFQPGQQKTEPEVPTTPVTESVTEKSSGTSPSAPPPPCLDDVDLSILRALHRAGRRLSQVKISQAAQRPRVGLTVISARLPHLENLKLIDRPSDRPKGGYGLTAQGRAILDAQTQQ